MQLVARLDLEAVRNDTFEFFLDFYEDEAKSVPFVLTPYEELYMQIKRNGALALQVDTGLVVSNTNRLTINIPKEQTNLVVGKYAYDIEVNDTDTGERRTILHGLFTVLEDVTIV